MPPRFCLERTDEASSSNFIEIQFQGNWCTFAFILVLSPIDTHGYQMIVASKLWLFVATRSSNVSMYHPAGNIVAESGENSIYIAPLGTAPPTQPEVKKGFAPFLSYVVAALRIARCPRPSDRNIQQNRSFMFWSREYSDRRVQKTQPPRGKSAITPVNIYTLTQSQC